MTMNQTMSSAQARGGQPHKHQVSGLFVFLLIAAYAVFSLMLVLIGVQAYQSTVAMSEQNAELRTTIGYISGRIHASDGKVDLRQEGDHQVLTIGHALGEADYETRIYYAPIEGQDTGGLYEQVIEAEEEFDPELGELISEIGRFEMSRDGHMLLLHLVSRDGGEYKLHLNLFGNQVDPEGGESA